MNDSQQLLERTVVGDDAADRGAVCQSMLQSEISRLSSDGLSASANPSDSEPSLGEIKKQLTANVQQHIYVKHQNIKTRTYYLRHFLPILALFVLTVIFLICERFLCYLSPRKHAIGLDAAELPLSYKKYRAQKEGDVFGSYFNSTSDIVLNTTSHSSDTNLSEAMLNMTFPVQIMVNFTAGKSNRVSKLTFLGATAGSANRIRFITTDSVRRHVYISPPWFSYAYWHSDIIQKTPDSAVWSSPYHDSVIDFCRHDSSRQRYYHSENNVPLWVVNLDSLATGRCSDSICNADYELEVMLPSQDAVGEPEETEE